MARKRKKLKDLDYNSKEYWNRLLSEDGLSVDAGRNPKLIYVGGSEELLRVEASVNIADKGINSPKQTDD